MGGRRWFNRGSQPDAQLRSSRPQARDEFVESLAQHVVGHAQTATWARSRLAFAGAVSTFILGTLVSFGGLSYAASGAAGSYHTAKQVAVHHTLFVSVHKSSAADQYAPPPKRHHKKHHRTSGAVGVAGEQNAVTKPSGTLPFTGISLLTTLVVSLLLIATGVFLRRRERGTH
jgi:hypothetical protein